jgi:RimJ/RimL family protein N-acetyltransferase
MAALNPIIPTLKQQTLWLEAYHQRYLNDQEYYFVIEKEGARLGLIRLYNIENKRFTWGSWIIESHAPKSTALQSALLLYRFAFESLDLVTAEFEVKKDNEKVIRFHQKFGAAIIAQDDVYVYFRYTNKQWQNTKIRYKKFL